jgi:hypothetical protein
VADVSVYYFMRRNGPGGEQLLSNRRATLETIKNMGEALLPSVRIVDHTEVDGNGFLIGGASDESHPVDRLWPIIRSLELRAKSRDDEAQRIAEGTDSERKSMLRFESLELRNQARELRKRLDQMRADQQNGEGRPQDPVSYGRSPQLG